MAWLPGVHAGEKAQRIFYGTVGEGMKRNPLRIVRLAERKRAQSARTGSGSSFVQWAPRGCCCSKIYTMHSQRIIHVH